MWDGEKLWKRFDVKFDKKKGKRREQPEGWKAAQDPDSVTGHWTGWMPIDPKKPEDKWHVEALAYTKPSTPTTYELVGPKVNTNHEGFPEHRLIIHGDNRPIGVPRDYDGIKAWLEANVMEGLVWHTDTDDRMAKIKSRDFGLPWPPKKTSG